MRTLVENASVAKNSLAEDIRYGVFRIIAEVGDEENPLPEGVLLRAWGLLGEVDAVNQNGRIYPSKMMRKKVRETRSMVNERGMFALADHPSWSEPWNGSVSKIAGIVQSQQIGGDHPETGETLEDTGIYGYIDVIESSKGRDVAAVIRAGGRIGISQRGYGTVAEDEYTLPDGTKVVARIVQDDYTLEGWDFVLGPSVKRAGVDSYRESKEGEMTLEELKERYPDVYEAVLQIGRDEHAEGESARVEAAEVAARAAATEAAAESYSVEIQIAAIVAEAAGDAEDKVEFVKAALNSVDAAKVAEEAAKASLEAATAETAQRLEMRKVLRDKLGANGRLFLRVEGIAFGADGKPQMSTAALEALCDREIETAAKPPPGAPPAPAVEGTEPEDAQSEENKRVLDNINKMRQRGGMAPLTYEQYFKSAS